MGRERNRGIEEGRGVAWGEKDGKVKWEYLEGTERRR